MANSIGLDTLPHDVLLNLFSWLTPHQTAQIALTCRSLNEILKSHEFQALNSMRLRYFLDERIEPIPLWLRLAVYKWSIRSWPALALLQTILDLKREHPIECKADTLHIDLFNCRSGGELNTEDWDRLSQMVFLRSLSVRKCIPLEQNWDTIRCLVDLQNLCLYHLFIVHFPDLSELQSVTRLIIDQSRTLQWTDSIASLSALEEIIINNARHLTVFTLAQPLEHVQRLSLASCGVEDQTISYLGPAYLPQLRELDLTNCLRISGRGLSALQNSEITTLILTDCKLKAAGITELATLTTLNELHLSGAGGSPDLRPLVSLKSLHTLIMTDFEMVRNGTLSFLRHLDSLSSLDLSLCDIRRPGGEDGFSNLSHCRSLLSLDVSYNRNLRHEDFLQIMRAPKLQSLNITGCPNLTTQTVKVPLMTSRSLRKLILEQTSVLNARWIASKLSSDVKVSVRGRTDRG